MSDDDFTLELVAPGEALLVTGFAVGEGIVVLTEETAIDTSVIVLKLHAINQPGDKHHQDFVFGFMPAQATDLVAGLLEVLVKRLAGPE